MRWDSYALQSASSLLVIQSIISMNQSHVLSLPTVPGMCLALAGNVYKASVICRLVLWWWWTTASWHPHSNSH